MARPYTAAALPTPTNGHAVLDLATPSGESADATTVRRRLMRPLRELLDGRDALAVDYCCGRGALTGDLARAIDARAIGVDPDAAALHAARTDPRNAAGDVAFMRMPDQVVPLPDEVADIVFACDVLWRMPADRRARALAEIGRVLKPGGLFAAVERADDAAGPAWQATLLFADLQPRAEAATPGGRVWRLTAGRKCAAALGRSATSPRSTSRSSDGWEGAAAAGVEQGH